MTEIELSITRLAAMWRSPYQIESELGIPHYTIHQKYHAALMAGYSRRADLNDSKSKASKAESTECGEMERKRDRANRRDYYQKHKTEIKEKQRQYRQANKEKIAEHMRQYRAFKRQEKQLSGQIGR